VSDLGRVLLALGLGIAALGALLLLAAKLSFLGRLPGDIVVRRPGFTLYLPFGSSILLSLLLTLLAWFFRR
jgi:hypothetical protein